MSGWQHPDHYTDAAKAHAVQARAASIAVFVELALPSMREAARKCGYALAVHGSQSRDLDLVAVAWTDEALHRDVLIQTLAEAVKERTGWGHVVNEKVTQKPLGRVAITMVATFDVELDISIISPRKWINS